MQDDRATDVSVLERHAQVLARYPVRLPKRRRTKTPVSMGVYPPDAYFSRG